MLNFLIFMLASTLRMGTPIALTALGGLTSERSGVVNIGLEGIMLASAFGAVLGSYLTGNPWIGVLTAILVGVLISAIHSVISITWGGNQSVSSMALVLLATGFSGVGLKAVFGQQGSSPQVPSLEHTPILSSIPVVGGFLSDLSPFVYIAFLALILIHCMFKYTPLGLRIITVGENPKAAETAGLSVHKIRYFSVILSGVLGGLGGAFLSLGQMNLFQEGAASATRPIQATAMLPKLLPSPYVLNLGIVIALTAAVVVYFLLNRTSLGYEMCAVGLNKNASLTNGINVERNMFLALLMSGALAGLAGGIEVTGTMGKVINGFSANYGFSGIPVALMARNNPFAIILTALLMGSMRSGSLMMQSSVGVSKNMVDIIQGLVIVFLCAENVIRYYIKKGRGGK